VPTQLCYTPAGTVTKWGYEVEPADGRIQYIKLLLDLRQELPHWVSRTELDQQLKTHAKTATSAAADYLTKLHEMARTELVKRYGEDFVESTSIEYILTVPAVWSDAAKHATVCAAQMAGLGEDLRMISEPEAAAVYSLSTMKSSGLKVGDVYIVLDAGGGTVDLITYEVLQMKPLKFREVVTGTGRLCGGAFLNLRFQDFVKLRLGERAFQTLRDQKPKHGRSPSTTSRTTSSATSCLRLILIISTTACSTCHSPVCQTMSQRVSIAAFSLCPPLR